MPINLEAAKKPVAVCCQTGLLEHVALIIRSAPSILSGKFQKEIIGSALAIELAFYFFSLELNLGMLNSSADSNIVVCSIEDT